jgi:glycosyltransferase involved in cell wall biosynthesis
MLSVIVNFYNNRREAPNTLHSLTRAYQKNIQHIPYEVIALDNGSTLPLSEADVRAFGPEFRYAFVATDSPSPVTAINMACREVAGDFVMIIIDGAHILTPGIIQLTHGAFRLIAAPFVATVPFHLGPKKQNRSILEGYNQDIEDALLSSVGWRDNGYRLFNATGSYSDGSLRLVRLPLRKRLFRDAQARLPFDGWLRRALSIARRRIDEPRFFSTRSVFEGPGICDASG